jgi:macrophage erythroblast attacher
MVDLQLFAQSEKIEEALRNHSCKECLAWCNENRSSLRKMKVRVFSVDFKTSQY